MRSETHFKKLVKTLIKTIDCGITNIVEIAFTVLVIDALIVLIGSGIL